MAKDLAAVALGDPNDDENPEGMLEVKGTNDQIRRTNLSKKIKGLVGQTYEFDDVTVQLQMGPRYGKRYDQFALQPIGDSLQGLQGFSRRAGGFDPL